MVTSIDVVREDVLDGLTSGTAAEAAAAFAVDRQPDGSWQADFGDEGHVYLVTVEQVPRSG